MLTESTLRSIITNRALELIILPTEQCNFRCTYCYEDFSIGKMQPNIVKAIKQWMSFRASELDVLRLTWFGGEPLVAKDIVYDISAHAMNLMHKHPGLSYSASVTTNGYKLTIPILSQLCELGVREYQVSLDGTAEHHDRTRKRLDGASTFHIIWGNLMAAKQSTLPFSIMIRLHVMPDNIDDMKQLILLINQHFSDDSRFSIFIKAIENLGGPNAGAFNTVPYQHKKQLVETLSQWVDPRIRIVNINKNGPYVCYAAKSNSYLIRANGRIGKCTVAMQDERNTVGQLQEDGTIKIDPEKLQVWMRGVVSQNLEELSCPAYKMPAFKSIPVVVER